MNEMNRTKKTFEIPVQEKKTWKKGTAVHKKGAHDEIRLDNKILCSSLKNAAI